MDQDTTIYGCGIVCGAGRNSQEAYRTVQSATVMTQVMESPWFPGSFRAPCFLAESDRVLRGKLADAGLSVPDWVNRTVVLACVATLEAIQHSGLKLDDLRKQRVGCALGTTVGCTFNNERYYRRWRDGENPDPVTLHRYLASNLAAMVQKIFGFHGPRMVVTNACSSGTDAIGLACGWLEKDICDFAIGGGADELSKVACHGFHSLMLVSDEHCTPFDEMRKGLNLGEGAGVMLLGKSNSRARRACTPQSAQGIGRILGYGSAGDGYHPTAPHPEGRGLQQALQRAMAGAGVDPSAIGMVNGHGTGTPANDRAETSALVAAGLGGIPLVSTKGVTGHTLGAAGGIEAVFTIMALNEGFLRGTVGCRSVDPALPCSALAETQQQKLMSRIGISQSLAFGGGNSALILEGETV